MSKRGRQPIVDLLRSSGSPTLDRSAPKEVRVKICLQLMRGSDEDHDFDEEESTMEVDRTNLFDSVVEHVQHMDEDELKSTPKILYEGEEGEDYGGLSRDFFREWTERMQESELFRTTAAGTVQPQTDAICVQVEPDDEQRRRSFRTCGKVCGMALYHGYLLGAPLARCFLRLLVGRPPQGTEELQAELNAELADTSASDFRGDESILARSLSELGLEDTLTFSRTLSAKPDMNVELRPGGADEVVTNETKGEWLESTLQHKLVDSIAQQAEAFGEGEPHHTFFRLERTVADGLAACDGRRASGRSAGGAGAAGGGGAVGDVERLRHRRRTAAALANQDPFRRIPGRGTKDLVLVSAPQLGATSPKAFGTPVASDTFMSLF